METWEKRSYKVEQVPEGDELPTVVEMAEELQILVTYLNHFLSGRGVPLSVLSGEGRPSCKEPHPIGCTYSGEKHEDKLAPEDWI